MPIDDIDLSRLTHETSSNQTALPAFIRNPVGKNAFQLEYLPIQMPISAEFELSPKPIGEAGTHGRGTMITYYTYSILAKITKF